MAALEPRVDEDRVVALTRELVRIPSVPGGSGGGEAAVAERVRAELAAMGLNPHVAEVAPSRPNVLARLDSGRPGPVLLFEAHTDVVSEGDPTTWSHDPFGADLVDGRIYGRGACDTKENLAAVLCALRALRAAGRPRRGAVAFLAPVDEEGLMLGIKAFIRAGGATGVDGAVACEPAEGLHTVGTCARGALRLAVRLHGRMTHGAVALAGANPLVALGPLLTQLHAMESVEAERAGLHPLLGRFSLQPTVVRAPIHGTPQLNVIPGNAEVLLDVRTLPGQDHAALTARIAEVADGVAAVVNADHRHGREAGRRREIGYPVLDPALRVEVETIDDRGWVSLPPDDPLMAAAADAVRAVVGREPVPFGIPGTTDGSLLRSRAGVPVVVMGAGSVRQAHHADEWVEAREAVAAARLYAALALRFCEGA
jgi:succinyl-diaminopimelate desuccinylase